MFSIISFNRLGNQSLWLHRKPDHVLTPAVSQAAQTFRRELLDSPANFRMRCTFDGSPEIEVGWFSVFATTGFAEFYFDDKLCATSLFLSGGHAGSDLAAIESIESMLASNPGNTFRMAFSLIRRQNRPLAASFLLAHADTPERVAAIRLSNEALAEAFFELHRPQLPVADRITPILKGA